MKDILFEQIKSCIESWQKDDIYAISLYVCDEEDNGFDLVSDFVKFCCG